MGGSVDARMRICVDVAGFQSGPEPATTPHASRTTKDEPRNTRKNARITPRRDAATQRKWNRRFTLMDADSGPEDGGRWDYLAEVAEAAKKLRNHQS